jgi:hypothetical protein
MSSANQPLASGARLLKEAHELVHDVEIIAERCGQRDIAGRLRYLRDRLREEVENLRQFAQPRS